MRETPPQPWPKVSLVGKESPKWTTRFPSWGASQEAHSGLTSQGTLGESVELNTGDQIETEKGPKLTATSAQIMTDNLPPCSGAKADFPASDSAHLQS